MAAARCVNPQCFFWQVPPASLRASLVRGWQAHSRVAMRVRSGESALRVLEEATAEAAKHGDRSERLSALVVEARAILELAKAE
jgi:hypothetical protein